VLVAPVELVLQVVDAVLLLVPGHARAPCKQTQRVRTAEDASGGGGDGTGGRELRMREVGRGGLALEALEAGLALGAVLRALASLVLVAVPADGEGALVAGHEGLPVRVAPHVVAANLAHLAVPLVHRLRLQRRKQSKQRESAAGNEERREGGGTEQSEARCGRRVDVPLARHRGG
jgi:hypothetical protein